MQETILISKRENYFKAKVHDICNLLSVVEKKLYMIYMCRYINRERERQGNRNRNVAKRYLTFGKSKRKAHRNLLYYSHNFCIDLISVQK